MKRYITRQTITFLRNEYKYLVGWGAGRDEFFRRYNPAMYQLDYMIDSKNCYFGDICGIKISSEAILDGLKDRGRICFIIYPNAELEIIEQIQQHVLDFDIIAARLIDCGDQPVSTGFSSDNEDIIIAHALSKLGVENPYYVDIGVCHPVIRNNTYLFYERGYREGVLVEPNLDMCGLAEAYRGENIIVRAGACASESGILKYYRHPLSTFAGHNTFSLEEAEKGGFADNYIEVPVYNINQIMAENCRRNPDILDIDTEGMDYELLRVLDMEKYRAKIICTESCMIREQMNKLMAEKGYIHFMDTLENSIYIARECMEMLIK